MAIIINTIITTLVGAIVGYFINNFRTKQKENNAQTNALKNLLKSNLVNQYYVYKELGKIPRFIKDSWYSMYESYVELGGNSFVKDDIKPKWDNIDSYED